MDNKKIKILIESLSIGDSISFETTNRKNLTEMTESIFGNFVINKVSETIYSVLRIDESIRKASEKVLAEIPKLNFFNRLELKVSPSYVRAIISKYNKKNNDSIKVKKHIDGSIIYRSFDVSEMTSEQLSDCVDELNFLIAQKETPETMHDDDFDQISNGESIVDLSEDNEEIL